MQPKVSIVIPCYNKEKYIANMFDSVLAQEWDNVELVLVNDGSTDRTREIIAEYETKFLNRGYEVVIVDQENQGVAAAVRNGLMRITGEFVCQVDADDELDPRYVSIMAGWLWENPEYEWAACDAIKDSGAYFKTFPEGEHEVSNLEKWLQWKIRRGITVYLVRKSYFDHCKVIEHNYTERFINQEPQFLFPLILGNGKLKYIETPLYKYNIASTANAVEHLSKYNDYNAAKRMWFGYISGLNEIINRMPMPVPMKQRLSAMSELNYLGALVMSAQTFSYEKDIAEANKLFCDKVMECFVPTDALGVKAAELGDKGMVLFEAVENNIVGKKPLKYDSISDRVIAWGAMGQYGKLILRHLSGTLLEPTELWDLRGDGLEIKKPNPQSLSAEDTVLILTRYGPNTGGIVKQIESSGCNIIKYDEVATFLATYRFPQFYDGSVKFIYN